MRFCTSCGTQLQDGAQVCPKLWTKSSWSKSETDGWRPAWNGWSTWDEWSAWNGSSTGNVCKNKVEN